MKRWLVVTLVIVGLAGTLAGIVLAQNGDPLPEHPHMLVQRPVVGFVDGSFALVGWRKCVDLAAGRSVPLHAHHSHVHVGRAGQALFENAGHAVVPGSPLTPWANCAALEAALPILLE
jgi:hypothetical protein